MIMKLFKLLLCSLVLNLTLSVEDHEVTPCNSSQCLQTWTVQYTYKSGENSTTSKCKCGKQLCSEHSYAGSCKISEFTGEVDVSIHIGYCMTYDEQANTTYMGACPYNNLPLHYNLTTRTVGLPHDALLLNNFMCNSSNVRHHYFIACGQQRRQGLLCSRCEEGLGPAVMSYTHPCVECQRYGWPLYLALSFVTTTILCFLVILLRINVLSPPLNAAVLMCQVVCFLVNLEPCSFSFYVSVHRASKLVLPILTLYGFFNMDFFVYIVPPFCISSSMSIFTVVSLDYIVALYPLILAISIYILIEIRDRGWCRPCIRFCFYWPLQRFIVRFRNSWDIKGSLITAFATLYVLSFTKVVTTSVGLILTTKLSDSCGQYYYRPRWYYNASCTLFHTCHRPYAYLMFVILSTVIFLPSLYIFLYPCKLLHKCTIINLRIVQLPHEIAKVFYQSFKDGTQEGTIDCRWFAGIYLLIRLTIAISASFISSQDIQIIVSIVGMLLVGIFRPHTCTAFNCMDSTLFGGLAMIFILWPAEQSQNIAKLLIFFIPLIVLLVFLIWKSFQKLGIMERLKACYQYSVYYPFQRQGLRFRKLSAKSNRDSDQEQKPLLTEE